MNGKLKIFSGNSHPKLAREICKDLNTPLGNAAVLKFSNGEIRVKIEENVRGADAFVIQTESPPVNDSLMELILIIDALKRASARRITAVMPLYFYSRQDRKDEPRVPISAKTVTNLLLAAGVNRILTMDLHAGQIQGFCDIPFDNLYGSPVLLPFIRNTFNGDDLVIVSPDAGGVPRARAYARKLRAKLALIDKRRAEAGVIEEMNVIGEVEGRIAIILDDMIDTAGTLVEATKSLLERGASAVHACITHPILSGPAVERIANSLLESLVVTDTLPLAPDAASCGKIRTVSSAALFSAAIRNIHNEDSVSILFEILH